MNSKAIRISNDVCRTCKYRMGFGADPGGNNGCVNNVVCNYLSVTGHSRIFTDGKMAYDPKFCDKYDPGKRERAPHELVLTDSGKDEYDLYKGRKIAKERRYPNV